MADWATHQSVVTGGIAWLRRSVQNALFRQPAPIGFYFAKLWYYERLYPLIFTVSALAQAGQSPQRAMLAEAVDAQAPHTHTITLNVVRDDPIGVRQPLNLD